MLDTKEKQYLGCECNTHHQAISSAFTFNLKKEEKSQKPVISNTKTGTTGCNTIPVKTEIKQADVARAVLRVKFR